MSHSFRPTTLTLFAMILLSCLPLVAQTPYLVKDINPSTDVGSSNPSSFTQVGTSTFFVSYVPNEGYQLWKTDGTSAGTSLVIDKYFGGITSLTASGGKLFFVVTDIPQGSLIGSLLRGNAQLWTSDGTATGTKKLRDLSGNNLLLSFSFGNYVNSDVGVLADVNGTLYFGSYDDATGYGLWRTNGTPEGTALVKAIPICPDNYVCYAGSTPKPLFLTVVNGILYFVTYHNPASGGSPNIGVLWKSDGTETGTVIVRAATNFQPASLTAVNGTLFFTAYMGGGGLWKSDGTEAGTVAVASVNAQQLTNVNGTLFFAALRYIDADPVVELWKSDGTAEGTGTVKGLCTTPCVASTLNSYYNGITTTYYTLRSFYFTKVGGTLFYSNDGALGKSDGTAEGTVEVATSITPSDLVAFNDQIYFSAFDTTNGRELWKSDGTATGTVLVKDVCPGTCNGVMPTLGIGVAVSGVGGFFPAGTSGVANGNMSSSNPSAAATSSIGSSNGRLFFAGCADQGCEPWTSDGTSSGTAILTNLVVNTSSQISAPIDLNGTLLFSAFDGSSRQFWRTNGTDAGSVSIKSMDGYAQGALPVTGGALFLISNPATGYELWKTDGTANGTALVKTITPTPLPAPTGTERVYVVRGPSAVSINGTVYFVVDDGTHGFELWKSDGTTDGTVLVKDILAGSDSSLPSNLTNVGGVLFFSANDSDGPALWKSDGTEAGTVMVIRIPPPYADCLGSLSACLQASAPTNLTAVGNLLFLTVGPELWKSDGTAAGTVQVSAGAAGSISSSSLMPRSLTDVNGTLFFWSSEQLWKSDGTDAGTLAVKDFSAPPPLGSSSSSFSIGSVPMTNVNGTPFFVFKNQLWKSDGTTDGTVMVKDIPASGLMNVNGVLYFAGKTDAAGTELWKSDGREAGTVMVADIYPGANGSWPILLAISGTKLYFTANDGTHGTELWAVGVAPTTLSVSSSSSAITVGSSITLTATIGKNASVAPTGTVTFMDGASVLGTGTVNSSGVATLTTSALTAGTHSITATYGGDTNFVGSTSAALIQLILATSPNYTLSANPTSATVRAGGSATFVITATAEQYFNGTISFSCGTLPRGVSCNFSPATLNPTSATPAQTTLTVYTTANSAALVMPVNPAKGNGGTVMFAFLGGAGVFGALLLGGVSRRRRIVIALAVLALFVVGMTACGGGGSSAPPQNGTPVGPASVQVTATATAGTSAGNTTAHNLTITVNVQ